MEVRRVCLLAYDGGDGDAVDGGDVGEGDGFGEEGQRGGAAGGPERAVGEVRGLADPGTETLAGRGFFMRKGGDVRVLQGHEVGGEGCGVGLCEAREGKGAGDVEAGGRGGGGRGLMWVERAAVVFRGAEAVSVEAVGLAKLWGRNLGRREGEKRGSQGRARWAEGG